MFRMRSFRQAGLLLATVLLVIVPFLLVWAQNYSTHRGNNQRTGQHDTDPKLSNPGRSFLRWWDPLKGLRSVIDNWQPGATANPPGDWLEPTEQQAGNVITEPGQPVTAADYRYALAVPSTAGNNTVPVPGYTLRTFTWSWPAFATTTSFSLFVNIPVGPTDIDPSAGVIEAFQQRYFVYLIDGVVNVDNPGQPILQIVDTYATGGGLVRLGNNGNPTDVVFEGDGSGPITITLLNTIPRDNQGNLTDTRQNVLVYADAAVLSRGFGSPGSYVASPVVGQLTVNAAAQFPWRVITARNEPFSVQVGSRVLNYDLGIVRSMRHNGFFIDVGDDGTGRRNIYNSFPAKVPFRDTVDETNRYAQEKRDFILGKGPGSVPPQRAFHNIDVDNASVGVTYNTLAWAPSPAGANNKGFDYLTMLTDNNPLNVERVVFAPNLGEPLNGGNELYELYVWIPGDSTLCRKLRVEVYEGGVIDPNPENPAANRFRIDVDQAGLTGWVRLQTANRSSFRHNALAPLYVAITNYTNDVDQVAKPAYADMVRFVKVSNLSIRSTPVMVRARVRSNGGSLAERDVVIAAYENGRIYCMDAEGNADGTTNVHWVYPSEVPDGVSDPNQVAGEDGRSGIAENPIGFDMSSALVQRVETSPGNFEDLLYIGSRNGRVYCIEMAGRGDGVTGSRFGTTRRRWSYPDDFPAATRVISNLGPIVGSLTYNRNSANQQTIYVPTVQGRLYALDAVGDPSTKTTTVNWTYPLLTDPTIGPIRMTPAVRFGRVFFGTGTGLSGGNNRFYAVNEITHTPDWTFAGTGVNPTVAFSTSSPTVVAAADVNYVANPGGPPPTVMPNTVFISNNNQSVYALNADTGAIVWETPELKTTAVGSPTFTYMRVFNKAGLMLNDPGAPVIVYPTIDGRWVALFAHVDDLNLLGNTDGYSRTAWGYSAEGERVTASVAVGGQYPADNYCWLYGLDDLGYVYAWNDDPGIITPGEPPGRPEVPPNDNLDAELNNIVANGKIAQLTPADYEGLVGKLRLNTLRYTDITGAINTRPVRRTNYDYGENLYYIVYDIPAPATLPAPLNSYALEMQWNSAGSPSQRRSVNVQRIPITQGSEPTGVAFTQYPILGSGGNALAPGKMTVTTRAVVQSRNVNRTFPRTAYNPSDELRLANALALITAYDRTTVNLIGTDLNGFLFDAADPENVNNGNFVGLVNPTEKPIEASLGPDVSSPRDRVAHGQTASAKLFVLDRSLMTLLYGADRGLQNVRVSVNDLAFNVTNEADNYGVIKPLDPNGSALPNLYPYMEELPVFFPNISLDYPDMRRESMKVTKEVFGGTDNPMFQGVGLEPPKYDQAARTAYRGVGYNDQLSRRLTRTDFNIEFNVAKYQPPSRNGYTGQQVVYVDANQPGRNFAGGVPSECYRTFNLFGDVAVDERLRVGTPTVDLGSLPAGAGFLPIAPWDPGTIFTPWNPAFGAFFQRFTVFNEGNVNLLNVRLAQTLWDDSLNPARQSTIKLGGPSLHELAWLDAPLYLNSDLDPRFAPAPLGSRVILQKARPGQTASRLSVNPERLPNPNLGVVPGAIDPTQRPGPLLDPTVFEPGDPKVGVTAPIGTPVGSYVQQMYVFEDRQNDTIPGLGPDPDYDPVTPGNQFDPNVFEPWAEPGFQLKFNIRETRLTNLATPKAAPMVDNLGLTGTESFYWSSTQPAAIRDGNGNLFLAFASDRQGAGGPDWASRLRVEGDAAQQPTWRLYIAGLDGGQPPAYQAGIVESAIRDLNSFLAFNNAPGTGRWFRQEVGPFPSLAPASLFNAGSNATIEPGSIAFGSPVFPANGVTNPMSPMGANGRTPRNNAYLAFVGDAVKRTSRGDRVPVSRIFMATVNFGQNGSVTVNPDIDPMPFDDETRKTRPAMVQVDESAVVFYTSSAAGLGQISWSIYRPNSNPQSNGWSPPQNLFLGNGFESVGTPAISLRDYVGAPGGIPGQGVLDLSFTAKMRGRPQAEAFFGRIATDGQGRPTGQNPILSFGTPSRPRQEGLIYDAATGTYWAPGVEWVLGGQFTNVIDLLQLTSSGVSSIVVASSRKVDETARTVSFDTIYGGKVYLDAANGSIRFSGALIPRNAVLGIRYVPRFLRISTGIGANYRGASINFDERFTGEFGYWATPGPNQLLDNPISTTALARNDRFLFTFARTSGDGSSATRPFMRTFRFGVQLPSGVQTDNNGNLTRFKVTVTPAPASQVFYQVDPANGRVYFNAECENRTANIDYDGVDEAGRPLGRVQVSLFVDIVPETLETAVPIEQIANESALTVVTDPQNGPFNSQSFRRPPLYWLFWTSTRGGAPDLYFETIAPRFTPLPPRR